MFLTEIFLRQTVLIIVVYLCLQKKGIAKKVARLQRLYICGQAGPWPSGYLPTESSPLVEQVPHQP
jgi:hypothetical protein